MRVMIVSYFYASHLKTEEDLLRLHYTTTGWAEALATKGIEVIVLNRFHSDSSLTKNNVRHLFFKDRLGESFKTWQIPFRFLVKIKELNTDIVHLHHLTLSLQTILLRLLLPAKTAIIIQHHGGKAPGKFKRWCHNILNSIADAFFFTTQEQGMEWFMKKKPFEKILPVMEGATFFNYDNRDRARKAGYCDRNIARQTTKLNGAPVFLWVGRLDQNKDPLTIIKGFETICTRYENAKLYLVYSDNPLEQELRIKIDNTPLLKNRVFIRGKVPHEEMEAYYNSADYFVLGSHYEGSGYALSEALRCGCVPVITNIPSFTMMTNEGRLGALWQPGNVNSFIEAIDRALSKNLQEEANACINFYEANLSFNAIAETAICHYRNIVNKRQGSTLLIPSNA